jgi:hypothetical protein
VVPVVQTIPGGHVGKPPPPPPPVYVKAYVAHTVEPVESVTQMFSMWVPTTGENTIAPPQIVVGPPSIVQEYVYGGNPPLALGKHEICGTVIGPPMLHPGLSDNGFARCPLTVAVPCAPVAGSVQVTVIVFVPTTSGCTEPFALSHTAPPTETV